MPSKRPGNIEKYGVLSDTHLPSKQILSATMSDGATDPQRVSGSLEERASAKFMADDHILPSNCPGRGGVAQRIEHRPSKPGVAGSIPAAPAIPLRSLGLPCTNPDVRSICLSATPPTWAQIEDCKLLEAFIRERSWFTVREIRIPLVEDYGRIRRRNTEGWRHLQRKASAEAWLRSLGFDDVEFEAPAVYGDADVRSAKAGLTVECGQCIPWRLFTVIERFGDPVMVLPYGDDDEWETGYLFVPSVHAHIQLQFTGILSSTPVDSSGAQCATPRRQPGGGAR